MFGLSPKQDLILLAAKFNYPESSWAEISSFILNNYGQNIPSEVCCERYERFLKYVEPSSDMSILFPSQSQSDFTQIKHLGKIPQNFIFGYRQLKQKIDNDSSALSFASIIRYQKKIICKLLFPSRQLKNKLIFRPSKGKNLIPEKEQQQLVDHIYSEVKSRSSTEGILTEEIVNQKIEQILFEIVEKLNKANCKTDEAKIQWTDPMEVIRLFQSYHLLDERRQVLDIYHRDENLSEESSARVAIILDQMFLLYGSHSIKIEEEQYKESLDSFYVQTLGEQPTSKVNSQLDPIKKDPPKQRDGPQSENCIKNGQTSQMTEIKQSLKPTMHLSFIEAPVIQSGEKEQSKTVQNWQINSGINIKYAPAEKGINEVEVPEVKVEEIKLEEVKTECKIQETGTCLPQKKMTWRKRRPLSKQIGKVWIVIKD